MLEQGVKCWSKGVKCGTALMFMCGCMSIRCDLAKSERCLTQKKIVKKTRKINHTLGLATLALANTNFTRHLLPPGASLCAREGLQKEYRMLRLGTNFPFSRLELVHDWKQFS